MVRITPASGGAAATRLIEGLEEVERECVVARITIGLIATLISVAENTPLPHGHSSL